MTVRVGDWIQTYSGGQFWPLDPRPQEIHIEDIAHSLSMQCRFAGHVDRFYSVAEHSVRASYLVPASDALWALLHDASEAYLVDLPRPIKRYSDIGTHYRRVEAFVMAAICKRFGLPHAEPESVKFADDIMLVTEARDLMKPPPVAWRETNAPMVERIDPVAPDVAERLFLERFNALSGAA